VSKLKIVEKEGRFFIEDEKESNHGSYPTRAEAQQALENWRAYYEAPLVF